MNLTCAPESHLPKIKGAQHRDIAQRASLSVLEVRRQLARQGAVNLEMY